MNFDAEYFFSITFEHLYYLAVLFLGLLTLALIFGIIWRTEKMLDKSFKYLAIAFIIFILGELYGALVAMELLNWGDLAKYFKAGFLIFFALAVWKMRKLVLITGLKKRGEK